MLQPYQSREKLIHELIKYSDHLVEENRRLKEQIEKLLSEQLEQSRQELQVHDASRSLGDEEADVHEAKIMTEIAKESAEKPSKKVLNRLYNIIIHFEIPDVPGFNIRAIVDTGATSCCANTNDIPEAAREQLNYETTFSGVNSVNQSRMKVKNGSMIIGDNKFRIPQIYCFDMSSKDGIQMLLG
ncbi:hypothetical protein MA16_Dca005407 [Dendrobium catenatum]|uniref:Retropepsins domain-containing protein n=1 Tax=Dendrobium catenatum TaxID=906689 RepID=A0A2I0X3C0_9ASPA|nr:hypothetical protein MA16_Dca005407 [Dendrobium catenatum]